MRDERADKVSASAIAQALAEVMPGWRLKSYPAHEDDELMIRGWARLVRDDGAQIGLRVETYPKLRLGISGVFPTFNGRMFGNYRESPNITVDPFKTAQKIADDISRRLLVDYLPLYAEAQHELRDQLRLNEQADRLGEELWNLLAGDGNWTKDPSRRRDTERLYVPTTVEHVGCDVMIQRDGGDEATFNLRLPGPLARSLANWIVANLQVSP